MIPSSDFVIGTGSAIRQLTVAADTEIIQIKKTLWDPTGNNMAEENSHHAIRRRSEGERCWCLVRIESKWTSKLHPEGQNLIGEPGQWREHIQ